jgi:hypothetical protein
VDFSLGWTGTLSGRGRPGYDSRSCRERYKLERVRRGDALLCFDGEPERIPAEQVERIELMIGRVNRTRLDEKTSPP